MLGVGGTHTSIYPSYSQRVNDSVDSKQVNEFLLRSMFLLSMESK